MKTVVQSSSAPTFGKVAPAGGLQALNYLRSGFSILWVILVLIFAEKDMTVEKILLVLYPAWDVVCTFIDIKISGNTDAEKAQYFNCVISVVTTTLIVFALQDGVPVSLTVFGSWAIITGLIQLIVAVRRKRTFTGQWTMIISGGQSMIGGFSFILLAHAPGIGIANLAGYAAFGAFYYLLSALGLTPVKAENNVR